MKNMVKPWRHMYNFLPMTSDRDSGHLKYLLDHPNPSDGERTSLRHIAFTYYRTDLYFSMGVIPPLCHMTLKNHLLKEA